MFQRRGGKCKEEEILVHNINQFNNKKDETESIEKSYDSRRVPKAAGRGGARYIVLYSLMTASVARLRQG